MPTTAPLPLTERIEAASDLTQALRIEQAHAVIGALDSDGFTAARDTLQGLRARASIGQVDTALDAFQRAVENLRVQATFVVTPTPTPQVFTPPILPAT